VLTDDGALPLAIPRDRHGTFAPVLIPQAEGAKFWMNVFADLQTRGCRDILIAVADGLKGFPEALEAVFPPTTLQTCVVHLLRHRLTDVGWKKRKAFAAAEAAFTAAEAGPWGRRFPTVFAAAIFRPTRPRSNSSGSPFAISRPAGPAGAILYGDRFEYPQV